MYLEFVERLFAKEQSMPQASTSVSKGLLMPVNSQDLIASVQGAHAVAACEADWRGVCSRAYYSIYQDGLAFHDGLPSPGSLTPDSEGGRHADLIDRLIHPTIPRANPDHLKSVSIGYMMQAVYANRIKSDYKRDKLIDKAAADNAVELIGKIAAKLNTGSSNPPAQPPSPTPSPISPQPLAATQQQPARGKPTLNRIK
jgi:hypothetical protein